MSADRVEGIQRGADTRSLNGSEVPKLSEEHTEESRGGEEVNKRRVGLLGGGAECIASENRYSSAFDLEQGERYWTEDG